MSLARAATRSRRSDHPQHPSRLEPRRPPSRRYTCADRQATSSCGRHGQHRSHKQPPSRARLEITRPVRRRPLARGHVAPRLDGRLPKLTALSYLGLAPPPHGKCAGRRVWWWCHIDRAASVDTHDSALAAVLGLDDERRRAASSQETRARVDEPGAREPANKALALPEPLDPARKGDVVMRYRVCCLACVQRTHC